MGMQVPQQAKHAELHAVVTRCGCGDPAAIHPGMPCPLPRRSDDLGTIAYWDKNPLKVWWWKFSRFLTRSH